MFQNNYEPLPVITENPTINRTENPNFLLSRLAIMTMRKEVRKESWKKEKKEGRERASEGERVKGEICPT